MRKIIVLVLICGCLLLSAGCVGESLIDTNVDSTENNNDMIENSALLVGNPLISEDMWGDLPSAEEAATLCGSYEDKPGADYRDKESYDLLHMDARTWILKNKEGKTLYCKDGLMYGDMPYYVLTSCDGKTYIDDGVYDGGKFYVDASDEYIYLPGDVNNAGITIGTKVDNDADGEYMTWVYDDVEGQLVGAVTSDLYTQTHKHAENDGGVYLYSGINVEKVIISKTQVEVFGDNAHYGYVKVVDLTPPSLKYN